MGLINIEVAGSFSKREFKTFKAIESGHADCVAQAIQYLAEVQLPAAIALDHQLHTEGEKPALGFAVRKPKP